MPMVRDWDGVEHDVRYRRVPGYYNRSTYHVDVDGEHVMDVRRVSDATWSRSAVWSAYRPGPNLWVDHSYESSAVRHPYYLTGDRSRELVVASALRKLQRQAVEVE